MIYSAEDFKGLRAVGRMASEMLDYIGEFFTAGVSTYDLDRLVAARAKKLGAVCATLGYGGYTKSCCISRNEVICHGVPSKSEFLQDGDIVNMDVTLIYNGYFGDTSRMFGIGRVAPDAQRLCDTALRSLDLAIAACAPDVPFEEIGRVIEDEARREGFSVVREFCGHGTGRAFHEPPEILHFFKRQQGAMREGEVFTIEPMLNAGGWRSVMDAQGWVARTADGSLSAQWEHTIGITKSGAEVFTKGGAK